MQNKLRTWALSPHYKKQYIFEQMYANYLNYVLSIDSLDYHNYIGSYDNLILNPFKYVSSLKRLTNNFKNCKDSRSLTLAKDMVVMSLYGTIKPVGAFSHKRLILSALNLRTKCFKSQLLKLLQSRCLLENLKEYESYILVISKLLKKEIKKDELTNEELELIYLVLYRLYTYLVPNVNFLTLINFILFSEEI